MKRFLSILLLSFIMCSVNAQIWEHPDINVFKEEINWPSQTMRGKVRSCVEVSAKAIINPVDGEYYSDEIVSFNYIEWDSTGKIKLTDYGFPALSGSLFHFIYDNRGLLINVENTPELIYNFDGKVFPLPEEKKVGKKSYELHYDQYGRLISKKWLDESMSKLSYNVTYEYDDDCRTETLMYEDSDRFNSKIINFYDSSQSLTGQVYMYRGKSVPTLEKSYEYDSIGYLRSCRVVNDSGIEYTRYYDRNEFGDVIKEYSVSPLGRIYPDIIIYDYQYDQNGNWIVCDEFSTRNIPFSTQNTIIRTERKLLYYN